MMRNSMYSWIPECHDELVQKNEKKKKNMEQICVRTRSRPSIGKHSLIFVS